MYNILKITIVTFLAILISNIFTIEFANSQPLSMEGTSSNDKIIGREGNDNIEGHERAPGVSGWCVVEGGCVKAFGGAKRVSEPGRKGFPMGLPLGEKEGNSRSFRW